MTNLSRLLNVKSTQRNYGVTFGYPLMEHLIKASIPPFAQIMDATSYDFLHRITSFIFKSKAGMAYEKSIINIDINFDNEDRSIPRLPKPAVLPRKDRKDKISTIQPSAEAQRTSVEIQKRVQELQKFRRESQSAVDAPLLVTALIRKTHQRLDTIEVRATKIIQFVIHLTFVTRKFT